MSDAPPKAAKESPKIRMWAGILGSVTFGILGTSAIWDHKLLGKSKRSVSPIIGDAVGSLELAFVLYMLVAWIWGGYRDLRAERKKN